jgi:hypothetical protein
MITLRNCYSGILIVAFTSLFGGCVNTVNPEQPLATLYNTVTYQSFKYDSLKVKSSIDFSKDIVMKYLDPSIPDSIEYLNANEAKVFFRSHIFVYDAESGILLSDSNRISTIPINDTISSRYLFFYGIYSQTKLSSISYNRTGYLGYHGGIITYFYSDSLSQDSLSVYLSRSFDSLIVVSAIFNYKLTK